MGLVRVRVSVPLARALMQLARASSDLLMFAPSLRRFELWTPVRIRVRVRVRSHVIPPEPLRCSRASSLRA